MMPTRSAATTAVAVKTVSSGNAKAYTKDAVADTIGNKDKTTGELVRLLFFALEEADTRSWQSSP